MDIIEDKLGDYKVIIRGKKNKPTTIQYLCRCRHCRKLFMHTGSPTTRRKTLANRKTIICMNCGNSSVWRDYVESIGFYYEVLDMIEKGTWR